MTKIRFLVGDEDKVVVGVNGENVMNAALAAGIPGIVGECGGMCSCGTCHIYVENAEGLPIACATDDERALLEIGDKEIRPNSRLACQIEIRPELDGLTVRVPQ